jgi:hypothetical protein
MDTSDLGEAVLEAGAVPRPPHGPYVHGPVYPIAFDSDGVLGAVAFASWDLYPRRSGTRSHGTGSRSAASRRRARRG